MCMSANANRSKCCIKAAVNGKSPKEFLLFKVHYVSLTKQSLLPNKSLQISSRMCT